MIRYLTLRAAVIVIMIAFILFLGWTKFRTVALSNTNNPALRVKLAQIVRDCRPVGARLVGFSYAPANKGCANVDRARLASIVRKLDRSPGKSPNTIADAAVIRLIAGHFDESIDLLERAASLPTAGAEIWSDLGSAYLARALKQDAAIDLVRALSDTEKSLNLKPDLAEALFNRALLLENLYLRNGAEAAWRRFLDIDSSSPWRMEAMRHLYTITHAAAPPSVQFFRRELTKSVDLGKEENITKLVASDTQASRLFLEEDILPRWASTLKAGDVAAASELSCLAMNIAQALQATTGDRLPMESAKALARGTGANQKALIRGHLLYQDALEAYTSFNMEVAVHRFSTARVEFRRGGSPFALWADLYLAICDHQLKNFDSALVRLARLESIASSKYYLTLHGRAAWMAGRTYAVQANPQRAEEELIEALSDFKKAKELGNIAAVHSLLAGNFHYLGNDQQAWQHRREALATAVACGDTARLPIILSDAARSLARSGETEVALLLQGEALSMERRTADPLSIAEALWWRALIHNRAGHFTEAVADLDEAAVYAKRINSKALRAHIQAGLAATEGAVFRIHDPQRSIGALSRSLDYFHGKNYEFLLTEILLERGRAWLAVHSLASAEVDFRHGIEEYERQRRRIQDTPQQVVFFDQAETIFDDMVCFQWDQRRNFAAAFDYADRSKARSLLDAIERNHQQAGEHSAYLLAGNLQRILPRRVAIVAFYTINDRLLSWCFIDGHLAVAELKLSDPHFKKALARLSGSTQGGGDRAGFDSDALIAHKFLIGGFDAYLARATRIIFVPDKDLLALPFAALRRSSGRYLVEDYEVVVVPSVASIPELARRAMSAKSTKNPRALVLGDLLPDSDSTLSLPFLPSSGEEARRVAALYQSNTLLLNAAATSRGLISNAPFADILHIAGHAVTNRRNPYVSGIPLSSDALGSSSFLTTRKIAALPLRRAPLVMLSMCNSATGKSNSLEGILDLARPFLAAGAHAVIATLWSIDDQVASEFSVLFHRAFIRTHSAAGALREAQLAFLASSNVKFSHPISWAAYQVIGVPVYTSSSVSN